MLFLKSNRLKSLYLNTNPHYPLIDIGCDHGLLGQQGIKDNRFPSYYFIDKGSNQFDKLKDKIPKKSSIKIYQCCGTEFVYPESGNFIISGIGSANIINILENILQYADLSQSRIILLSHNRQFQLDEYLARKDLPIISRSEFEERKKTYTLITISNENYSVSGQLNAVP